MAVAPALALVVRLCAVGLVLDCPGFLLSTFNPVLPHTSLPQFCSPCGSGAVEPTFKQESMATPRTGSFMHLHLGIDATGLPADLDIHHLVVNQWDDIEVSVSKCWVGVLWEGKRQLASS